MRKTIINIEQTMWMSLLLVGVLAASCDAGFGADDGPADYYRGHDSNKNKQQLPLILMHKQALQQDGGFQYAFASDNGHRQGETIRPDGSRTGAYSYTDPEGKEITVKYTAGKDGFRIVQGDHVPKAPVSVVPQQPSPAFGPPSAGRSSNSGKNRLFSAPGGPGSQFSRGDLNSGRFDHNSGESFGPAPSQYKSAKFPKAQPYYRVREDNSAELSGKYEDDGSSAFDGAVDYSSHSPFRAPPSPAFSGRTASVSQKDDADSDERQPHSFGSGYAFEFAGTDNGGANGVIGISAEI